LFNCIEIIIAQCSIRRYLVTRDFKVRAEATDLPRVPKGLSS
jgi:hypothetical protein